MTHAWRRRAKHPAVLGVAALLASACRLPFDTVKDAYLEPDALAPANRARAWERPAEEKRVEAKTDAPAAASEAPDELPAAYDLASLVDVALRTNPDTQEAWEAARARAAAFGRTMGEYLPELEAGVDATYSKYLFEAPHAPARIKQYAVSPLLNLEWVLFDFGRRTEATERARRQLLAANLTFNRALQDVVFSVQTAYYALDAALGMRTAAERNLVSAQSVRAAAEERLAHGLATRPDVLLAEQADAKAAYELESARVLVSDAEARLALAVGLPADGRLRIVPFHEETVPPELDGSVDALIDEALLERPDLAARLEEMRAQEAVAREAEAELYPQIVANGSYGLNAWWYRFSGSPTIQDAEPVYSAGIGLRWSIFEGFERLNAIREAEAEAARARAGLERARLETIAEVWRAYHDQRAAAKKYEYARVLLASSREAYESNLESYRHGLTTIVDLLTAEGDLAEARFILIQSRADLLTQAARVAYVAGTIAGVAETPPPP